MSGFPPNHLFLNTPVKSVTNDPDGRVRLDLYNNRSQVYDHVIIATHGDQAYDLVFPDASFEEKQILSGFQTSQNTAILHSDLSLMPRSRKAWASWNYITESSLTSANVDQVCLTYNMNILQHIPEATFGPVLVTLNPLHNPEQQFVQGRWSYSHPLYNALSIRSQKLLPRIQNTRGISYCGAWTNYGFHEDGFTSGILVAQNYLGARIPFRVKDSTFSRGKKPVLGLLDLLLRFFIVLVQTCFLVAGRVAGGALGLVKESRLLGAGRPMTVNVKAGKMKKLS